MILFNRLRFHILFKRNIKGFNVCVLFCTGNKSLNCQSSFFGGRKICPRAFGGDGTLLSIWILWKWKRGCPKSSVVLIEAVNLIGGLHYKSWLSVKRREDIETCKVGLVWGCFRVVGWLGRLVGLPDCVIEKEIGPVCHRHGNNEKLLPSYLFFFHLAGERKKNLGSWFPDSRFFIDTYRFNGV